MKSFNVYLSMSYKMKPQLGLISSYSSSHYSWSHIILHSFSLSLQDAPAIVSLPNFYSVSHVKFKLSSATKPIPSSNPDTVGYFLCVLMALSTHTFYQQLCCKYPAVFISLIRLKLSWTSSVPSSVCHIFGAKTWWIKHTKFCLFLFRESKNLLL